MLRRLAWRVLITLILISPLAWIIGSQAIWAWPHSPAPSWYVKLAIGEHVLLFAISIFALLIGGVLWVVPPTRWSYADPVMRYGAGCFLTAAAIRAIVRLALAVQ